MLSQKFWLFLMSAIQLLQWYNRCYCQKYNGELQTEVTFKKFNKAQQITGADNINK